jgi:Tol biopolymer transport system component
MASPLLGDTPKQLIENVHSTIDWSPDRHFMAFIRMGPVIADADGGHERTLATRQWPGFFRMGSGKSIAHPAWSPDGRTIAAAAGDLRPGAEKIGIVFLDTATGAERFLPARPSGGLEWLGSQSLVLSGSLIRPGPGQLSVLSYPDGKSFRLTNDLNSYNGISLSGDRNDLVTSRTEVRASIWIGDSAATTGADVVPVFSTESTWGFGIAWAGDRLLYTAGGGAIMSVLPGGTPEQIAKGLWPASTSDGRMIVFNTFGPNGGAIMRTESGGQHVVELLKEEILRPIITPDDQHVVYMSGRGGNQSLWMIPLEGGSPVQINQDSTLIASVSPDSKRIVFWSQDEQNQIIVTICDMPGCTSRRNLPPMEIPKWMPDGSGVAGFNPSQPRLNLWVQPLDGKPAYQLTRFNDPRPIVDFTWSHDGKRLAIARATSTSDIVLFKGLRK